MQGGPGLGPARLFGGQQLSFGLSPFFRSILFPPRKAGRPSPPADPRRRFPPKCLSQHPLLPDRKCTRKGIPIFPLSVPFSGSRMRKLRRCLGHHGTFPGRMKWLLYGGTAAHHKIAPAVLFHLEEGLGLGAAYRARLGRLVFAGVAADAAHVVVDVLGG